MAAKPYTVFLIITSAGLFVWANTLSLKWAKSAELTTLLLITVISCIGYMAFGKVCSGRGVAIASGLIDSSICIGTILVSYFLLGETFNAQQIAGLCCAVAAVLLLI